MFTELAKNGICSEKAGFSFYFSNQCPFMEEYVYFMAEILKSRNLAFKINKIESLEQAKNVPVAFGTFGIFYNGKFVSHELMAEKKFNEFIDKLI